MREVAKDGVKQPRRMCCEQGGEVARQGTAVIQVMILQGAGNAIDKG